MMLSLALALLIPPTTGHSTFRPTPAEADVPAAFRMEEATFPYESQLLRATPNYTVEAVRFPSPVTTADAANNTVHAEYFRPSAPGKRPAVVVLHILGADFALSRYVAARLADRGVAAMFVKLPYYGERRPAGDKRFLSADIERSVGSMRQGVLDVRRAAAWLAERPEVDARRVGVAGISLGGIIAALAASVDPNIREAAILLAGGELHEILWAMPEGGEIPQALGRLRADEGRPEDADLSLRPGHLRPSAQGQAGDDDGRERRRGHPARVGPRPLARRGRAADRVARLRPLFGRGVPAAGDPPDGRFLRRRALSPGPRFALHCQRRNPRLR